MAIVLDGAIASAPNLNSRIERDGIIEGRFTQEEVKALKTVLQSGSLVVKPTRLSKASIGPTLGEASIQRGVTAGIVSISFIMAFMLLYYLGLGVISCLTLILGIYLLIGGLGFLAATLTLPGIAGIVLTIGMAVDQNILINERIREERAKGKTLFQSVKNGFERAFTTIVDAQATTFIAGFILFKFGTGPIRGFAVTLMLGIVTTMFAAIAGSKILFAIALERDWFKKMKMMNFIKETRIAFSRFTLPMVTLAIVLLGAGLALFGMKYQEMKGLDFAGGFEVHVELAEATPQPEVNRRVVERFPNARVVSMVGQGRDAHEDGSREFLIKIPAEDSAAAEDVDQSGVYLEGIESALGELLIAEGIESLELVRDEAGRKTDASFRLNFSAPLPQEVVASRLKDKMAVDTVAPAAAGDGAAAMAYDVKARFGTLLDAEDVRAQVASCLRELPDEARLSNPLPASQFIGATVGKELRNNAIIAMVLAVVAILIYVRVRFHGFEYGFAACVAVAYNALFGLGAAAAAYALGLNVEIDLVMVGAFLTIIGYSINDTIVIFDRVRENLPRVDRPIREIVDLSINQTLSRTFLTGGSVLIAVAILFAYNLGQRNVLEGFSYSMGVGVLVGTFSTIFIACPLLVWLVERRQNAAPAAAGRKVTAV
jgi:SecD/SecF fusion protein